MWESDLAALNFFWCTHALLSDHVQARPEQCCRAAAYGGASAHVRPLPRSHLVEHDPHSGQEVATRAGHLRAALKIGEARHTNLRSKANSDEHTRELPQNGTTVKQLARKT